MKTLITYLVLLAFLIISCSDDKEKVDSAFEIRNIGELSTTEFTIGKIIKLEDKYDDKNSEWYEYYKKYGERKILISCKAKVKAGIDLKEIKESDIVIKGNSIEITLPKAKITSFSMDPSDIRTEMESVTGLRSNFTQEEKNDFLKQGEEQIREELVSTGILEEASDNAAVFVTDFYRQLGFENVIIKESPTDD